LRWNRITPGTGSPLESWNRITPGTGSPLDGITPGKLEQDHPWTGSPLESWNRRFFFAL